MNDDVFAQVSGVLVDKFHVEPSRIHPNATLESLGLDSLTLMEFVFEVEDQFSVRVPEGKLDPRQAGVTLAQLAELLEAEQNGQQPSVAEAKTA